MTLTNDIVTISGNIGNDPTHNTTRNGDTVVNFRVGSSSGHWDRNSGVWIDDGTSWYAVSAFRTLAEHAKASLRRGDAVIVTGALKVKEWENDARKGISADIVADAIGHDLNKGTSAFARRPRVGTSTETAHADAAQSDGAPQAEPSYDDQVPEEHVASWGAHGLQAPVAQDPAAADEESTTEAQEEAFA